MIFNSFSKDRMKKLNKMSFPMFELPLHLKILWVEAVDFSFIRSSGITKESHQHSFYEVHFVCCGTVTYWWDNQTVSVPAGHAFIIPANKPHRYVSGSDDVLKIAIAFSGDPGLLEEGKTFPFDASVSKNIDQLFALSAEDSVFTPSLMACQITEILHSAFTSLAVPLPEPSHAKHDPRFEVAKAFIEKNLHKKISCCQVANECCLSEKQLNRVFSKETGSTVSGYINLAKIELAKKLLLEDDCSIKEICYMVGFENESSFITFFKKFCSVTPGTFKRQMDEK